MCEMTGNSEEYSNFVSHLAHRDSEILSVQIFCHLAYHKEILTLLKTLSNFLSHLALLRILTSEVPDIHCYACEFVPDEKLPGIGHRLPSPLSTSIRPIKIVSEAGVESRREDEALAVSPSGSEGKPPVAESFPSPELVLRQPSPKKMSMSSVESLKLAVEAGSTSPTVEAPSKSVQMHSRDGSATPEVDHSSNSRGLVKRGDRDNLSLRLDQANKGCGCNIL